MKKLVCCVIAIVPLLALGISSQVTKKSLLDVGWAGGWIGKSVGKVTMNKQVFADALESGEEKHSATWDLNKKCDRLTGIMGMQDDWRGTGQYSITVDGQLVEKGTVTPTTLKAIDVDLEAAKSLNIELSNCCFAEPRAILSGSDTTRQAVRLKAPENGSMVSRTVQLKWSTIEDATSYGINLVCLSIDASEAETTDRIFSYTAKGGKTTLELDTKLLPLGRYRWAVVAFGSKKMLGSFSEERTFTVQR